MVIKFNYNTKDNPSSYILKLKVLDTYKNSCTTKGIIDTGSGCTVIPSDLLGELNLQYHGKVILKGINGINKYKTYYADVQIGKTQIKKFKVATMNREEVIIGRDLINLWVLKLDGESKTGSIDFWSTDVMDVY